MKFRTIRAADRVIKLPFADLPPFQFSTKQKKAIAACFPKSARDPHKFWETVELHATSFKSKWTADQHLRKYPPAELRKELKLIVSQARRLLNTLNGLNEVVGRATVVRAVGWFTDHDAYQFVDDLGLHLETVSNCLESLLALDIKEVRSAFPDGYESISTPEQVQAFLLESVLLPISPRAGRPPKEGEIRFIKAIGSAYFDCFHVRPSLARTGKFSQMISRIFAAVLGKDAETAPTYSRLIVQALGDIGNS
ncbi:MAG: hypothetical protein AB7V45_09680 [Candidatus Krumholzibacteriia bacterium]